MKTSKYFLSGIMLFSGYLISAQAKLSGNVLLNAGVSISNHYRKLFIPGLSTPNGPLYPLTQTAAPFIDFNVIYFFKNDFRKFKPILGLGYNPQGFTEKGIMFNDSQKLIDYRFPVKMDYAGFLFGFSYPVFLKKQVNLKLTQTLNPMFDMGKSNSSFKKFVISTRSSLIFGIKLANGNEISISPFFQTSIFKFNKSVKIAGSPDYFPYSYGINIGTCFKH